MSVAASGRQKPSGGRQSIAIAGLLWAALAAACAGPGDATVRQFYFEGDYEDALLEVQENAQKDGDNAHLWALQEGLIDFALSDPGGAVQSLGVAKQGVLERTSYASKSWFDQALQNAGAMLSDDNALPYGGRDYEHLMMYSLLTLGELLQGGRGDEMAYGFQGLDRLIEAIDAFEDPNGENPKEDYALVPLGEFLRAAFYEETPSRISDTQRAYNRFLELVGDYAFADEDLARLSGETRKGKDKGVVYVLSFVGEGPSYEEHDDFASAAVLQFAQVFAGHWRGEGFVLPNIGAIKSPRLAFPVHAGTASVVRVDGQPVGQTAVVADLWASARAEYEAMHDMIMLRAFLRRVFKVVTTEVVANQTNDGALGFLARVGGSIWTLTEKADLRGWSLLPASVQAIRLELLPGPHTLEVQAVNTAGHPVGLAQTTEVFVNKIYHSYVLGILPCTATGGSIVSSSPVLQPSVEP